MLLAPSETGFAIAAYWHPRRMPTEFELKVASALDMAGRAALRRLKSGAEITELKELIESIRLSHRELAHRLKNAYASVIGVARLTLDADAADDLGARLKALSAVHDLLDRETGHPPGSRWSSNPGAVSVPALARESDCFGGRAGLSLQF